MSPAPTRPAPGAAPAAGKRATAAKPGVVRPSQTSRLFESLMKEAQTAPDRVAWARAVCRAAGHQARAGQADRALQFIANVRTQFGPGLHPEVASWLMLAEGVLHWCKFEIRQAHERIIRARALAVALKSPVAASCAAWMAVLSSLKGEYEKMAEYLTEAFTLAADDDHQARARAALVLADAYHFSSGYGQAQPWYEEARQHITKEGDEAMLGAMLYNVGLFRLVNIRLAHAFGHHNQSEVDRLVLEAGGSLAFDYLTSNSNQIPLRHVLQGQLAIVKEEYDVALEFLEKIDSKALLDGKMEPVIKIDMAWCQLKLGNFGLAAKLMVDAEEKLETVRDTDDKAYILGRISSIANATGDSARFEDASHRAAEALARHVKFKSNLAELLNKIPASRTIEKGPRIGP